jgi:hypothetical protein
LSTFDSISRLTCLDTAGMTADTFSPRKAFLQRNWNAGIKACSLDPGDSIKLVNGVYGPKDHYRRSPKRRRLDFDYGAVSINHAPSNVAGTTENALRIDVVRLFHKDLTRVRNLNVFNGNVSPSKDVEVCPARCKITIQHHRAGRSSMLHCDSRLCNLKSWKNPFGPSRMGRIYLSEPFTIPQAKINIDLDDEGTWGIGDDYTVIIELESAGRADWPPISLLPAQRNEAHSPASPSARHWILSAVLTDLFGRPRVRIPMTLDKGAERDLPTDFVVDVDVRWTTGLVVTRLDNDTEPTIEARDPDEPICAPGNGHFNGCVGDSPFVNGHTEGVSDDVQEENDDDGDEDSDMMANGHRPVRNRGAPKVYNLKVLSDKAQGKERKRRQKMLKKKPHERRVTYNVANRLVRLQGFRCVVCAAMTEGPTFLRTHLLTHPEFEFSWEYKNDCWTNSISVRRSGLGAQHLAQPAAEPFQMLPATEKVDLDRQLEGDDSWLMSRFLLDENDEGYASSKFIQVGIGTGSYHSFLITDVSFKKTFEKVPVRRRNSKILVPKTGRPLFDPVSRARLEVGTEVVQREADIGWVIHKNAGIVDELADVTSAEKEYMKAWDAFVYPMHLNGPTFLPRALLGFVTQHAAWIVTRPEMAEEFSKHFAVLMMMANLKDEVVTEVLAKLQEARTAARDLGDAPGPNMESDKERGSESGCVVCRRPVRGPSLLLCSNKVSLEVPDRKDGNHR